MSDITIIQGEGKDIRFTYTTNGTVIDVSSNTFYFIVKSNVNSETILIEKEDADFDKTDAASGIVTCNITATESAITANDYYSEIQMTVTAGTDIDKAAFTFTIKESGID